MSSRIDAKLMSHASARQPSHRAWSGAPISNFRTAFAEAIRSRLGAISLGPKSPRIYAGGRLQSTAWKVGSHAEPASPSPVRQKASRDSAI